jgi:hypothetical protein
MLFHHCTFYIFSLFFIFACLQFQVSCFLHFNMKTKTKKNAFHFQHNIMQQHNNMKTIHSRLFPRESWNFSFSLSESNKHTQAECPSIHSYAPSFLFFSVISIFFHMFIFKKRFLLSLMRAHSIKYILVCHTTNCWLNHTKIKTQNM